MWRVPADGGEENQVWDGVIYEPALSPDGKLIAYLFRGKGNDNRVKLAVMMLADQKLLKTLTFPDKTPRAFLAWASDNKSFYYITTDDSQNSLWRQSLNDRQPHLVRELGNEEVAHLAISPDESRIAFIRGRWIYDAVLSLHILRTAFQSPQQRFQLFLSKFSMSVTSYVVASKSQLARAGRLLLVLVRVTSWIGFVFVYEERSTKSHERNTKLVISEIDI